MGPRRSRQKAPVRPSIEVTKCELRSREGVKMHSIGEIWPTGPMPDRKDGAMRDVMRTPGSHYIESADSTGCKYFALWLTCEWVLRSALQERDMVAVSRSDRLG